MDTQRSWRRGAAIGLGTVAVVALANPSAQASGAHLSTPRVASWATNEMVVPDKIQSLGASTYANLYGGLVVINSGASYQVFLTKLDPAVEAAFVSAAGGANLQFHRTAQSQRSQYAAQAKLMAHMSQLGSDGVDILDIIPEVRTGRLIVDVLASKSTMSSATIGGANAIRALLGSASAALVDTHAT